MTPWGTYLTCEENFMQLLQRRRADRRRTSSAGACARAARATAGTSTTSASTPRSIRTSRTASAGSSRSIRTTASSTPVKRTALGRAAHEGAWVAVTTRRPRGRVHGRGRALRVHLQVRQPRHDRARRRARPTPTLLDHGTLYVARFDADGSGAVAAAGARPGPADRGQRLRRPGRGADQGAPGERRCWAPPRWTGPSGSRSIRSTR